MSHGQGQTILRTIQKEKWATGITILLAVLGLALSFSFLAAHFRHKASSASTPTLFDRWLESRMVLESPQFPELHPVHPVFPFSVIPGGAQNGKELLEAVHRESVVSAHYAEFHTNKVRVIRLDHDRLAYVSYRLGNQIYWTKKKVTLYAGESLLSDGENLARTRCGNRVSQVAKAPTAPSEPTEKVLSTPIVHPAMELAMTSLPDAPAWPVNAAIPALMALGNSPGTSASTPGGSFPPFIPLFCCGGAASSSRSATFTPISPLPQPGYPPLPPAATPEPHLLILLLVGCALMAFLAAPRPR